MSEILYSTAFQNSEWNRLSWKYIRYKPLFYDSQKLNAQIETIQENKLDELKTMVDLGSQFFVQAHV